MGKIALELKMQWLRERGLVGAARRKDTHIDFSIGNLQPGLLGRNSVLIAPHRATSIDSQRIPWLYQSSLVLRLGITAKDSSAARWRICDCNWRLGKISSNVAVFSFRRPAGNADI